MQFSIGFNTPSDHFQWGALNTFKNGLNDRGLHYYAIQDYSGIANVIIHANENSDYFESKEQVVDAIKNVMDEIGYKHPYTLYRMTQKIVRDPNYKPGSRTPTEMIERFCHEIYSSHDPVIFRRDDMQFVPLEKALG